MHAAASYEANKRHIDSFSWKVVRRLHAAGVRALELADVQQELAIAWMKAAERWNPEIGVPFGAYLYRGMKLHINRWAETEVGASQFAPYSLDTMPTSTDNEQEGLHDVIADTAETPEESCHYKMMRAEVGRFLSPTADLFLKMLEDPPPELVEIFRAKQAKAAYARSRGISCFEYRSITEALVFDLLDLGPYERKLIRQEISTAVAKVRGKP